MRKFGIVALFVAAIAIVCSAWMIKTQEAATRRDQATITVSYDTTGIAYVWEWKGSEIISRTTYGPSGIGLSNYRLTVGNR